MTPNYARQPFAPQPKLKDGQAPLKVERARKSIDRGNTEDAAKKAAKERDGKRCRWPHRTPEERLACRRSTWKEAMHYRGKGMGGNKDGSRNVKKNLLTGCPPVHQGPTSIHAGMKRLRHLTPDICDGPMAFDEKVGGQWVEVGREISVGVLAR